MFFFAFNFYIPGLKIVTTSLLYESSDIRIQNGK